MKAFIKRIPILGEAARRLYWKWLANHRPAAPFPGTVAYWEQRYAAGGDSGVGSYDFFAEFKAEVLNAFVREHGVQSVVEFGCGDGNQLGLARYPRYLGFDVSAAALARCRERFRGDETKSFRNVADYAGEMAELALSLDVVYHLVEDEVFERYMRQLFRAAEHHVIVYASDTADNRGFEGTHVRHRKFTRWIEVNEPRWQLVRQVPNRYPYRGDYRTGSFADFFVYGRR